MEWAHCQLFSAFTKRSASKVVLGQAARDGDQPEKSSESTPTWSCGWAVKKGLHKSLCVCVCVCGSLIRQILSYRPMVGVHCSMVFDLLSSGWSFFFELVTMRRTPTNGFSF